MPEMDIGSTISSAVNAGVSWVTQGAASLLNAGTNAVSSIGEGISNFFNSGDGTERYTGATQSGSEYIYSQSAVLSECTFLASRLFGGPILFTDAVDPHLDFDGNIMGRMTAQRIMHDPTIISLSPGKVKFSSGLQGDGADQLHKYLMDPTNESTINGLTEDSFASDKLLYTFEQDYNNYMNYVNMIARVMSVYMGIGQKTVRLPFADGTLQMVRHETLVLHILHLTGENSRIKMKKYQMKEVKISSEKFWKILLPIYSTFISMVRITHRIQKKPVQALVHLRLNHKLNRLS